MRGMFALACVVGFALPCASAQIAVTDGNGRITTMTYDGDHMSITTDIRLPLRGWKQLLSLSKAKGVKVDRGDGRCTWQGQIEVERGKTCRFEETLEEVEGAVQLDMRVTAEADLGIVGVYFWLDVPIEEFAGGRCTLADGDKERSAEMPRTQPEKRHFITGDPTCITMADAADNVKLTATFDRPCHVTVQDTREFKGKTYSAYIALHSGPLSKGQRASLRATLKLTGKAECAPAHLALDASRVRYRLDGFGGNYCFGIESPVTQYTLDNLNVAWARTEMTPGEWEPTNDNDSPTETDWDFLRSHDKPDSNLRREFLLAQQIQKRGIPYCISIWHLPEWLYAEPGKGPRVHRRRIAPDKWPELLECLGSYLVHAKKEYGVEPNLFSFNEANAGVRVYLSAEEHRDAIKRIGAHFESLGLKTKMLLADATGARGTHVYAEPAANDPEAMRYVGAVGFHSWGGASPEEYGAWADLAERLKLPLVVAELGVDAGAWHGRAYDSFHYGLREVGMYQELVLYARPQGTMQWEFTSDYSTVHMEKDASGAVKLTPTSRFWFVKHFCNLTPRGADVLGTQSDHPKVLFTAFAKTENEGRVFTLHVANMGAAREATISGIPDEIKSLRAVRTSETDSFRSLDPVAVRDGVVALQLAPQSLLTLTTLPVQ